MDGGRGRDDVGKARAAATFGTSKRESCSETGQRKTHISHDANRATDGELSFAELLEQSYARDEVAEVDVAGEIINITKDFVLIDVGYKLRA